MSCVHIIGGGLAGLSAAVELAPQAGLVLYEAGPACGGRARSFYDRALETEIDNGNHMLLSANPLTFRFLDLLEARHTLKGPGRPIFPWFDLATGEAWTLRLSEGRLPFWLFDGRRNVPGMKIREVLALQRLIKADEDAVVADCLGEGAFARRLLEPLAVSALNTGTNSGSARLLGNVIARTLAKGGKACCPWMAKEGLSRTFVDPALAYLARYHAKIRTGTRVTALSYEKGRVTGLETSEGRVTLGRHDSVIIATPAPVAAALVPGLEVPDEFESIANAHYHLSGIIRPRGIVAQAGFVGLVGGMAEWVFLHKDVISVTVSAANRYQEMSAEEMLLLIWQEILRALNPVMAEPLPAEMPKARLIREKRASFAATPAQNRRRPGPVTPWLNLALAGDWTDTGLPSTIEGAIQSGLASVAALGFRAGI